MTTQTDNSLSPSELPAEPQVDAVAELPDFETYIAMIDAGTVSMKEAAELLGVSIPTVWRIVGRGDLRPVQVTVGRNAGKTCVLRQDISYYLSAMAGQGIGARGVELDFTQSQISEVTL